MVKYKIGEFTSFNNFLHETLKVEIFELYSYGDHQNDQKSSLPKVKLTENFAQILKMIEKRLLDLNDIWYFFKKCLILNDNSIRF